MNRVETREQKVGISVSLPLHIVEKINAKDNRSAYILEAILEKLARDTD